MSDNVAICVVVFLMVGFLVFVCSIGLISQHNTLGEREHVKVACAKSIDPVGCLNAIR